jgi:hypothetical protein
VYSFRLWLLGGLLSFSLLDLGCVLEYYDWVGSVVSHCGNDRLGGLVHSGFLSWAFIAGLGIWGRWLAFSAGGWMGGWVHCELKAGD